MEDQKKAGTVVPSNSLGLDLGPLIEDEGLGELGPLASKVDFGLLASELDMTDLTDLTGTGIPNISVTL